MSFQSTAVMHIRKAPRDWPPDADLTKAEWQEAEKVSFMTSYRPDQLYPEICTAVAGRWTPSYVYFAFWAPFIRLNVYRDKGPGKKWGLWNRDVVEVFLNPFPEKPKTYWEFEVAPDNQEIDLAIDATREPMVCDAGWNSGFEHATFVDKAQKIWFCEMRIPARPLGLPRIEAGMVWRANFYRCDGSGDDSQRRFLAWSPTLRKSFHVPERFGALQFED
ncbi:MAG TPA: carbohydrate-binding family 9-like protein [Acidobacteriota bacterium]|nr:carbohydrate-binding family 9-like protein [Acidobacteriota bacterium]